MMLRRSERLKSKVPTVRYCRKKRRSEKTFSHWEKLDQFTKLKAKGRVKLDIMLSSTNGGENHGIHSEVISALDLPKAVKTQITKKTNENPKTIKLNLSDDEISALVKFAYTGEIDDGYLESLRDYGLNSLYEAWREKNYQDAIRPRFSYALAISGWIGPGPGDSIEVLQTRNTLKYHPQLNVSAQKWKRMNTMLGQTRAYHGSAVLNNQIYIFGGYVNQVENNEEHRDYCRELFVFNPNSKEWELMSLMVEKRCYVSSAALNNQIYAIGGFNGRFRFSSVECYNPENNEWAKVASMNSVRSDGSAVAYKPSGTIYAIGGFDGNNIHASVDIYYPSRNEWSTGPRMNTPRTGLKTVVHDEKIYAIGGFDGENRLQSVEVLEPLKENKWKFVAPMNLQRSNHAVVAFDDKILAMGGFQGEATTNLTEIYYTKENKWKISKPMNYARSALSAVMLEDQTMDFQTLIS